MPTPAFMRLKRISRSHKLHAKKKEAKEIYISLASHKRNADAHAEYQVNNCKNSLKEKTFI